MADTKVKKTTIVMPEVAEKKKVVRFGVEDEDDNTNAYIGKQHLDGIDFSNGVRITITAL